MAKMLKLLILTNHVTHAQYDSIFDMAAYLHQPESGCRVFLSSMANSPENFACRSTDFTCREYTPEFSFETRDSFFTSDLQRAATYEEFDSIFFRIDRVMDTPTVIYDYFEFVGATVPDLQYVNSPQGLLLTKSKRFLENFPDICPEFKIVETMQEALDAFEGRSFVLKPLDGFGGQGIIKIDEQRRVSYEAVALDHKQSHAFLGQYGTDNFPIMAMKFLENVTHGDKRTIVTCGVCLGSVLRVPAKDSWLANMSQGATVVVSEPDENELEIVERIDPFMRKYGVSVYGMDTLVDDEGVRVLSEINTINVGGFVQIKQTSGRDVLKQMADLIIADQKASELQ